MRPHHTQTARPVLRTGGSTQRRGAGGKERKVPSLPERAQQATVHPHTPGGAAWPQWHGSFITLNSTEALA